MNQETTPAAEKLNPKHEVFIRQMILHNDKVRAYQTAYPDATDESARVAASRLLADPNIKERLRYAYNEIELGVREDKAAFINQELKIINVKREMLLKIITGAIKSTVAERIKAIRLDTELADQQAKLLGYGSIKQPPVQPQPQPLVQPEAEMLQPAPEKNAETVTKMNKKTVIQFDDPAMKQFGRELNRKLANGLKGQSVNEAKGQKVNKLNGQMAYNLQQL